MTTYYSQISKKKSNEINEILYLYTYIEKIANTFKRIKQNIYYNMLQG